MVSAPAILLRVGCALPDRLHLKLEPFGKAWMSVENAAPAQMDIAVRDNGWRFMWIESACSRLGFGRTDESAASRAITRALAQIKTNFNAAELSSVHVARYLGLRIAKATLYTRQIQQG